MAEENYCIVCEVLIKKPLPFDGVASVLGGGASNVPVKFKSGWKCARCAAISKKD